MIKLFNVILGFTGAITINTQKKPNYINRTNCLGCLTNSHIKIEQAKTKPNKLQKAISSTADFFERNNYNPNILPIYWFMMFSPLVLYAKLTSPKKPKIK